MCGCSVGINDLCLPKLVMSMYSISEVYCWCVHACFLIVTHIRCHVCYLCPKPQLPEWVDPLLGRHCTDMQVAFRLIVSSTFKKNITVSLCVQVTRGYLSKTNKDIISANKMCGIVNPLVNLFCSP